MFTGLVEALGSLEAREERGRSARLSVASVARLGPLTVGESVAVDGVCLTVDAVSKRGFLADASFETLARSTLGGLAVGARVHLERAVAVGQRLGGHIVSGHVDGVGEVAARRPVGDVLEVTYGFPPALSRYIAEKGSITVSGVSLTVNRVGETSFDVVLVPRTIASTKLGDLAPGARVNLEVDVLARYCERLLRHAPESADPSSTDEAWMTRLRAGGYL